ncbi:MAG: COX15/CtaA family protein [Saprospiraceae bacterium]|jgi:cytochrome c oxidase assembly protein subunit 15
MTNKYIGYWLLLGVIMIFIQIFIGGVTRLTGSGLSITKWEIVTGSIPPINEEQWISEFELYKDTPQYKMINEGMELKDFKFIYFWEYFHRLWARIMGLVFLIPFIYFLIKGKLNKLLKKRLIIVLLLAALVASFGWIMVASGLIERPWVNAYKLAAHLSLAVVTLIYLFWVYLKEFATSKTTVSKSFLLGLIIPIGVLLLVQLFLGGIMSGVKAALVYPTWPNLHGEFLPSILIEKQNWIISNFINYDEGIFFSALIQFLHRMNGYLIFILGVLFLVSIFKNKAYVNLRFKSLLWFLVLLIQIFLGITVLINSIGVIPVGIGVLHQVVGVLLIFIFSSIYFSVSLKNAN